MIRKIVDDKTYIGYMVYGKTKIPDPGTGKEVPVSRNQWKVLENHHEPIVSKEVLKKHSPCRSDTPRKANLIGK